MGSQEKCLSACIHLTLSGGALQPAPVRHHCLSASEEGPDPAPLLLVPLLPLFCLPSSQGPSAAPGVIAEGTSLPPRRGCRIAVSCSWAPAVLFSALPVVCIFYSFGCKASCIPLKSHRLDSAPLLILVQCCLTMSFPF